MFDIQNAISALDFRGVSYNDRPNLEPLRAQYPDIGFVFDELERLWDVTEDTEPREFYEYERDRADQKKECLDDLAQQIGMIKEMFDTLASFDCVRDNLASEIRIVDAIDFANDSARDDQ